MELQFVSVLQRITCKSLEVEFGVRSVSLTFQGFMYAKFFTCLIYKILHFSRKRLIWQKTIPKSTCLTGSFVYQGASGNGVYGTLHSVCLSYREWPVGNKPLHESMITNFFNSLAPGIFELNFRKVIFKLILVIDGWSFYHEIAIRWLPLNITDDKSTLAQVMVWWRQAASHYRSHCWPRSMSPYGVTGPQWVNALWCDP